MQLMKICHFLLSSKLNYSFQDVCFTHILFPFFKLLWGQGHTVLTEVKGGWKAGSLEQAKERSERFFPLPSYGVGQARTVQLAKGITRVPLQGYSSIHGL